MKKVALSFAVCMLALGVFAQITQDRNCSDFTGIKVSGGIKLTLTESGANTVKVNAEEAYQSKIITEVKNGVLRIYTKDGNFKSPINVYVTAKALNSIDASGASEIAGTNVFNSEKLDIVCSGASEVRLDIKTGELNTSSSGASSVKLKGTATKLIAEASGASNIKAYNLVTAKADVNVSGASNAKINASEEVKVIASGASEVSYIGSPKGKNVEVTGASKVNSKDKSTED